MTQQARASAIKSDGLNLILRTYMVEEREQIPANCPLSSAGTQHLNIYTHTYTYIQHVHTHSMHTQNKQMQFKGLRKIVFNSILLLLFQMQNLGRRLTLAIS